MTQPWQLEVTCLPLAPGVRAQLLGNGLRTVADVKHLTTSQLSCLAGITIEDASEVLQATRGSTIGAWSIPAATSAADALKAEQAARRVITFCADLDMLLDGGVCCGRVTEFCGVPGVGKTQLGTQLAVDVQIPVAFGGQGGAAVYIDTEGSFMADRVVDIAQAAVRHVTSYARSAEAKQGPEAQLLKEQAKQFTLQSVVDNIHVFRAHDSAQQLACVHLLPEFLNRHPEVRLVVMDSVTFHFRQDMKDFSARARTLTAMAQDLMHMAETYQVAVVLMNQVTTRVMGEAMAQLVPALGESWGHAASTRVLLHWQGSDRCAYMYKSPALPPSSAHYAVTADGVRGIQHAAKRPTPV